uniref:Uncharacterized protein n=1 Tax=Cacopsylla melanoneura TaxID=428564 RepID=A0A8D8WJL6_9HEMI
MKCYTIVAALRTTAAARIVMRRAVNFAAKRIVSVYRMDVAVAKWKMGVAAAGQYITAGHPVSIVVLMGQVSILVKLMDVLVNVNQQIVNVKDPVSRIVSVTDLIVNIMDSIDAKDLQGVTMDCVVNIQGRMEARAAIQAGFMWRNILIWLILRRVRTCWM